MDRQRLFLLYGLIAIFFLIAIGFVWDNVKLSRSTFMAGTAPPEAVDILPDPTLPPARATDPTRGSADKNALIITEFADFTCLYCHLTEPELIKALSSSPRPVRLVWRDLPIVTERPEALNAAVAGRCANEQGKFWEMHDLLFQSQRFDIQNLQSLAGNLRIDGGKFTDCMNSGKYIPKIQDDVTVARNHNIGGAPMFFVGNILLSGYVTAQQITTAIQQAK